MLEAKRLNLEIHERWILGKKYSLDGSLFDILLEQNRNQDLPTALIVHNDALALKIMRSIHDCGFKIPEDFSIIGHDDVSYCANALQRNIIKDVLKSVGIESPIYFVDADSQDKTTIVTSNLFDKSNGKLKILTVTNSDYGTVKDLIKLEKGQYKVLGSSENVTILQTEKMTEVEFCLESWQTFVLIKI